MSKRIVKGKAYTKRSGLTGKARQVVAGDTLPDGRVECIASDTGRTIIVRPSRLHSASVILYDGIRSAPNDELEARLSELLASNGKGDE